MAEHPKLARLLLLADLGGTFLFAIEGAMAAAKGGLDVLCLAVLAFATALGGGIIRDVLINAAPPAAIRDWRYPATAFAGAACVFFLHGEIEQFPQDALTALDAAGLSLFAVAGAGKALAFGINPLIAVLMGTITGVGGGTVRDVLLAQIPTVLRADIYATAAAAGALVVVIGAALRLNPTVAAILGGLVCFALRMAAFTLHWNLPKLMAP
jgi:uncharacterized membrane protein YeiH